MKQKGGRSGYAVVRKIGAALPGVEEGTCFLTDHYRACPYVLVRLSRVQKGQLAELLERAWRQSAPKRLVAARDREG